MEEIEKYGVAIHAANRYVVSHGLPLQVTDKGYVVKGSEPAYETEYATLVIDDNLDALVMLDKVMRNDVAKGVIPDINLRAKIRNSNELLWMRLEEDRSRFYVPDVRRYYEARRA